MAHKAPTRDYLTCQKKFVNVSTKPLRNLKLEIIITYILVITSISVWIPKA